MLKLKKNCVPVNVYLSFCVFVYLSTYLHVNLSTFPPINRQACIHVHLSTCALVNLSAIYAPKYITILKIPIVCQSVYYIRLFSNISSKIVYISLDIRVRKFVGNSKVLQLVYTLKVRTTDKLLLTLMVLCNILLMQCIRRDCLRLKIF